MADYKFSCPQCGQNILCDTDYSGMQINCPTCQQAIVVPQASVSAASPAMPAAPSPGRKFSGTPGVQSPVPAKPQISRKFFAAVASVIILVFLVAGGWFGYLKYKLHSRIAKLPSGLVALWTGDGNAKDIVAGNNGQLVNLVGFAPGKDGRAFDLNEDASGYGPYRGRGYVHIPASPSLDVGRGKGFTITAWINPATLLYRMPVVEFERNSGISAFANIGVEFFVLGNGGGGTGPGCLYGDVVSAGGTEDHKAHLMYSAPGLVTTNKWQHIALSYDKDSGVAVLYLNGASVLQKNVGSFTPDTGGNILLGGRTVYGSASSPSGIFSGRLGEVAIYNRALSASEVQSICPVQKN